MVDFERTHVIIQSTYKNILENFNPGLKQLITTGKALQKGLHNVSSYTKTYLSCLYDLARSAQGCEGGASELGESLLELADAYNTINQQLIDGIKFFHSELLIPLKSKQENEFRHVQICLDKYMVGHKYHTARLVKSQFALAKVKKKVKPKQQGFNKKEVQCAREVKEYSRMLEEYMMKNLRLALLEERKRYCYLFSKLSGVAQNDGASHHKAHELLTANFKQWVLHCKNPHVLPPSSEKFIKELGFTEDSFPSVEELPAGEPVRRATLSGGEIPSSNVAAPAPTQQTTLVVSPPTPQPSFKQQETLENSTLVNQNHVTNRAVAKDDVVLTKYNTIGSVPVAPRTPNDMVDFIHEKTSQSAPEELRSALFQLRAVHPFKASNESQLTMEAGDVISVYDDVNQGGWIFGLNENTNRIGWFPFSYTHVAELESLKTLSERLANLEDVFVKRSSRSLQESPNFNDARFRKQLLLGEKAVNDDLPPPDKFSDLSRLSQHGSEYDGQLTKVEERHEYSDADRDGTLRVIRSQARQIVSDEPRYETYSSLRLKTLPPAGPQPISATPRRSASRVSSSGAHYGTLGKTHRSLGALYSENLLRDLSHGPPPPPPPLPLEINLK